jgi:predicted TIM-barrel fold metal-dependent hydrolase
MIPLITLEEHFFTPSYLSNSHFYAEQFKWLPELEAKLTDLGPIRLSEMDKGAVSLQIISHGPGLAIHSLSESRAANDQLAAAIKKEGGKRFAGFAVLPMGSPDEAATELRRAVRELGFVGALVDNHADGRYYDGRKFWAVFEAAQELDVPIYLHPVWPDEGLAPRFKGNFEESAEMSMGSSGFGWHVDVGLHVLKLFAAGVFDEFPRLKIIIGHMGECLPFMHERIAVLSKRWGERKRDWKEVYDGNLWITTSGVWSVNPMACLLRNTKLERILYSVDYPFAKNEAGLKFMEELEQSGLVTKEQFEMIGYKNAEALLKVKVQQ